MVTLVTLVSQWSRSGRVRGGRSSCVVSSVGGLWELTRLVWPAQAPADSFIKGREQMGRACGVVYGYEGSGRHRRVLSE